MHAVCACAYSQVHLQMFYVSCLLIFTCTSSVCIGAERAWVLRSSTYNFSSARITASSARSLDFSIMEQLSRAILTAGTNRSCNVCSHLAGICPRSASRWCSTYFEKTRVRKTGKTCARRIQGPNRINKGSSAVLFRDRCRKSLFTSSIVWLFFADVVGLGARYNHLQFIAYPDARGIDFLAGSST